MVGGAVRRDADEGRKGRRENPIFRGGVAQGGQDRTNLRGNTPPGGPADDRNGVPVAGSDG